MKTSQPNPHTILIVEDSKTAGTEVQRALQQEGFNTVWVTTGTAALAWLAENHCTLLLLDYRLPDMTGQQLVESLAEGSCEIAFIVMTAYGDERLVVQMLKLGARDYLIKEQGFSDLVPPVVNNVIGQLETERRLAEAEQAVCENEERFRTIFEEGPLGMAIVGLDYRFINVNKKLCRMVGYTEEELTALTLADITHPEDLDVNMQIAQQLFADEIPHYKVDKRYIKKNREILWVALTTSVIRNKAGKILCGLAMIEDITERNRAEETLGDQEKKISTILNTVVDGIMTIDESGTIESLNPATEKIFGYRLNEMLGQNVKMLMSEPYQSEHDGYISNHLNTGEEKIIGQPRELSGRRKDGSSFPMDLAVSEVQLGKKRLFTGIVRDVSGRRRAERALASQEALYRTLIQAIPHVIWLANAEGHATFFNKAWQEWTGRDIEESLGSKWAESLHPEDAPGLLAKWERAYKHGEPYEGECRFKTKEGSYKAVTFIGTPVRDDSGKISNWVGINIDITERRQAEEKIKASLEEKEILLREIHHRVKNNLQVISSLLSLQSKSISNREAQIALETSQDRVQSMAFIHEKLYQSPDLASVDFEDYLRSLTSNLYHSYAGNQDGIALRVDAKDVKIDINKAMTCGLIINELVSNSFKYAFPNGRQGEIRIEVRTKKDAYSMSIGDNGIGLPEGLDFSNSQSLGLKLVKMFVKQLRGAVEVDAQRGTEFKILFKR